MHARVWCVCVIEIQVTYRHSHPEIPAVQPSDITRPHNN